MTIFIRLFLLCKFSAGTQQLFNIWMYMQYKFYMCKYIYIYISIPIPESSKYSKCLSRTVGFFVWKRAYILVQSWKFPTIILPPFLPRKHQFHYKARKRLQTSAASSRPVVFCFKQWPNQALATILEDFYLAKRDPFLGGVAEVLRCCDLWPPIFQNIMGGL